MASNTFSYIDSLDSLSPHGVEYAQKHILTCVLYISLYIYSFIQWVSPNEAIIAIGRICHCKHSNYCEKSFPVLSQSLNFSKSQVPNIKMIKELTFYREESATFV